MKDGLHSALARLRETVIDQAGKDLSVFAYGSLMWRAGFPHRTAVRARVFGYSRRLAVYSRHYRGTPEKPGLVFGLDRGGSCWGMLYHIAPRDKVAVIDYLFEREMFANIYAPRFIRVQEKGRDIRALTFVAKPEGEGYALPMKTRTAIRIIRSAAGVGGSNADYIRQTQIMLHRMKTPCPALDRLCLQIGRT